MPLTFYHFIRTWQINSFCCFIIKVTIYIGYRVYLHNVFFLVVNNVLSQDRINTSIMKFDHHAEWFFENVLYRRAKLDMKQLQYMSHIVLSFRRLFIWYYERFILYSLLLNIFPATRQISTSLNSWGPCSLHLVKWEVLISWKFQKCKKFYFVMKVLSHTLFTG